jgi:hypothetical protein
MYLQFLKENDKENFLSLAHGVSLLDGALGNEEQQMLDSYCSEMGVSNKLLQSIVPLDTAVINLTNDSSPLTKRIVIFELVGLAMSDGIYDKVEKEFIVSLISKFNLTNDYLSKCESYISDYMLLQAKINTLVVE